MSTWQEDMAAARVPWAGGMLALWRRPIGGSTGNVAWVGAVPDLTDRTTFLVCVDEAERRGVEHIWVDGVGHRLDYARSLHVWDGRTLEDVDRPRLIAGLARALRETAPATVAP